MCMETFCASDESLHVTTFFRKTPGLVKTQGKNGRLVCCQAHVFFHIFCRRTIYVTSATIPAVLSPLICSKISLLFRWTRSSHFRPVASSSCPAQLSAGNLQQHRKTPATNEIRGEDFLTKAMDAVLQQSVELVHRSSTQIVLYVTGGASNSLSWLLSVPGASNTILEAAVPYHRSAFLDIIGREAAASLTSFASASAARYLAQAAYRRAVRLAAPGTRVCGIAAACGLATLSKKGDHRAYVATYASDRIVEYELVFTKGNRTRWEEDIVSSRLVLQSLLDDIGGFRHTVQKQASSPNKGGLDTLILSRQSSMSLVRDFLETGDHLSGPAVHEMPDCVQSVLGGQIRFAEFTSRSWSRDASSASLIFPGSFNPLHTGHRELINAAKTMYPDRIAAFEISVTNPDKPSLDAKVVHTRLSQFSPDEVVIVSRAPLFSTKAQFFPNSIFVVGVDTAFRIVASKYYGGQGGMIKSLADLKSHGCKFAVAGRLEQRKDGLKGEVFHTLSDVDIPEGFEDMFQQIPFRADISSSEIRAKGKETIS